MLLLCPRGAVAQSDLLEAVDEFVLHEMERQNIPGAAVGIVRRGEVVVAKGYGLANLEHQVPVGPQTIFQSGSVGKQFTAAAVMLLVEEGRLALDESITTYLPGAPASWAPITLRHLLTHTSGIPEYTTESFDWRRDYSEDDLLGFAFELKPEFPAGSRWNYSNTGYVLLGIIIGRASRQFYGDLLRERVFAPLGMATARVISEEDIVPHRAAGYRLVDGELKNQEWVAPTLNTTADGSLYLSLEDLIAWDRGIGSQEVLEARSWAQVFEPVKLNSGKTFPYGFGWDVEEVAGQVVHRHSGSWQGFRAFIARYLGEDLTIVLLANQAESDVRQVVEGLAAIVSPALAPPESAPISDDDPEVAERLSQLLAAAAEGRLNPDDFAYVRAGFFPTVADEYRGMLRDLGPPRSISLFDRRELGDDRVSRYQVVYASKTVFVILGVAPDGKLSQFEIEGD